MKLSKIDYQNVNNNLGKFSTMEMSFCRGSSCINSTSLGKAILFRSATETEKRPDNFEIVGLASI